MLAIDHCSNGVTEIAQQMPAVSNLNSARCTPADPIRVSSGTIARNDLDARMLTKPVGKRLCLPVR
jgi:hypothetical protein